MSITTISSTILCPRWRTYPHLPPKITSHSPHRLPTSQTLRFPGPQLVKLQPLCFSRRLGLGLGLEFCAKAKNAGEISSSGNGDDEDDNELRELRGKSTMPDRFRYLTKEADESSLRWPWFVALAFLIYAWRSVLWELSNWRKALIGIFHFVGYVLKLVVALIFYFIGDPITYAILVIETTFNSIRSFYSSIVTSAPILELTIIIALASTVLAIGEAASPNSVNDQPYLLTTAGIIGYSAVRGVISERFFWLMLFGLFSYGKLVKKRDYVRSALPVATVLASVGEPWVRVLAIVLFTALAIRQHSNRPVEEEKEAGPSSVGNVPFPLLGVALAIGVRLATKWAGYRHLTWMIV